MYLITYYAKDGVPAAHGKISWKKIEAPNKKVDLLNLASTTSKKL